MLQLLYNELCSNKKKVTYVSKIMYNIHDKWTIRHLSLSFYCHIILYVTIATYLYVAKIFPKIII